MTSYLFTSESVSEGHPDKLCDRISDSIVDLFLGKDPESRVAIEALATTNRLVLSGEIRSSASVSKEEMNETARQAIKEVGYHQSGFNWETLEIENYVHAQSADIAIGVDAAEGKDEGAGDQGIMFGYAVNESAADHEYMPATLFLAHKVLKLMARARARGETPHLLPDSKSQVTLRYDGLTPVGIDNMVISTQHLPEATQQDIRETLLPFIDETLPAGWEIPAGKLYVNPTGRFVIGGPDGDTGLTGRKIIVDTYGGAAPHGGGAFSGKDPTKVDRSAAYMARYLAKNVVAAGLARKCVIQLAYAIGMSQPLSVFLDTFGTGEVDTDKLQKKLREMVDLSPRGIRKHLQLNRPIYKVTSSYGHFGRKPGSSGSFSWEKTDIAEALAKEF